MSSSGAPVAWITPTVRPMIETGTHKADKRPCDPVAELRTRIEVVAVTKALDLRAPCGRAAVGGVDVARGWFSCWRNAGHPQQMGVAVVGQEEFGRRFRNHRGQRSFDHVNDLGLAFCHVQSIRQTTFELLATCLDLALRRFPVRSDDGVGKIAVQLPHLAIGDRLLLVGRRDHRPHAGHHKPN